MKEDVLVEEVVDVEQAGTEAWDDGTITAYERLLGTMQKGYCWVYNSSIKDTSVQHSDAEGEALTESVNLVLTHPPYRTRREQNRDNYVHEVLSEDMKHFTDNF